jgi:putative ABC transport system permease protein
MKEPIGKELIIKQRKLKIIGVVKDFNLLSPEVEVSGMYFYHLKTVDIAQKYQ